MKRFFLSLPSASVLLRYGIVVLVLAGAWGWLDLWANGPSIYSTFTRKTHTREVVERTRYMTNTKIQRERVEIPVEVVREVPAKVDQQLKEDFGHNLLELKAEGRGLLEVVDVPKAPNGGRMEITMFTESGRVKATFAPKPLPAVAFGGMREFGVDLDFVRVELSGYFRQDLVRVGPAIVNGKAFAAVPLKQGAANPQVDYGVKIGVAVRF